MVSWDQATGTMVLNATSDTAAATYSISFTVANPYFGRARSTAAIEGNIFNSAGAQQFTTTMVPDASASGNHPMYVAAVEFQVALVGQSSPYPCDNNTLTVTFATNLDLYAWCNPVITVSGLTNAIATGPLTITPGGVDVVAASGTWSNGEIQVAIDTTATAGTNYMFSFTVLNPTDPQSSPTVDMTLGGISPTVSSLASETFVNSQADEAGVYNPAYLTENTAAPMYIRAAAFEAGQDLFDDNMVASQSSSYPCDVNTISVTVTSNVPLFISCSPKITLSGFTGSQTASTSSMAIGGAQSAYFSSVASWTSSGTLIVDVVADMNENQGYEFTFSVTNPNTYQAAPILSVAGSLSGTVEGSYSISRVAMTSDTTSADVTPLYVMKTQWLSAEIYQSNPLPCVDNVITVELATNVPLLSLCSPVVTISGITGTTTSSGVLAVMDGGGAFSATGTWTQNVGRLVISYASDTIEGIVYTFNFTVTNPSTSNSGLIPTAVLSGIPSHTSITDYNLLDDTSPVFSMPVVWLDATYRVGELAIGTFYDVWATQSSPYPCHSNEVTFYFNTSIALESGTTITISGLTGTQTVSTSSMALTGTDATQFVGSAGVWTQTTGRLVITVDTDTLPGTVYELTITVTNPTTSLPRTRQSLTILTDSVCMSSTSVVSDTWTDLGLYGTTVGDAAPGVTLSPAWITKNIGQSTPYPGCTNTIT
eukprot:3908901-Rhodomonas_salina.1